MKTYQHALWIGLCLVCTTALADAKEIGDSTRQWLELQKSQSESEVVQRPLSGPVAQRSYQRYLRSFEREIPEHFEQGRAAR